MEIENYNNLYVVVVQAIQMVEAKSAEEAMGKALNNTIKHPEDLTAVNWSII